MKDNGRIHKTKLLIASLLFAGLSLFSLAGRAVTIDFESYLAPTNLGPLVVIDGVTFSVNNPDSDPNVRVYNDGGSRTAFVLACDFSIPSSSCIKELKVDFGQQVSNLSFNFLSEDNASGVQSGVAYAYLAGSLLGSVNLISDGDGVSQNPVSLAAFGLIDQLLLDPILDPAGLGYDNFSFDVSRVPVPAAVWLFGTALIGLLGFGKQRKAA